MFGSAASMLALSQARSYVPIVILTCITGALSELYRPASYALVGDLVGEEHRVIAFGIYRFAVNLGFAAGPATAGFLADHSFTLLFIGDAATSIVYGLIALFALPHGLRTYVKTERTGEALRVAARDKPFLIFLLATLCVTIVDFQMGSTFALHVKCARISIARLRPADLDERHADRRLRARHHAVDAPLPSASDDRPRLSARRSRLRAHRPRATPCPLLAATVVIWTLGEMISSPVAGAYAVQLAPEQYRGRYLGLVMMMWSLGMVIGPPAGTFVFEHNPAAVWTACGALGVISAALMMRRKA